ncbi:L,D-transpeptidase family protein [Liquorilactobacillus mali]|uniref:L,D-transpeptidase family protein n=1 Tax=Liquorilactobacillus mali TaxID=1618 RepID=UPI0023505CE6|nr:L,D-transpeptidase family protein [Liquorilactobacillus mali]MDC7952584.1 L,D-transpeptidase family protein [Liquorilactobacillus mali]
MKNKEKCGNRALSCLIYMSFFLLGFFVSNCTITVKASSSSSVNVAVTQQLNKDYSLRGQKYINGSWYYFDDSTGNVVTGWKYIAAQKKTVYYAANGKMLYGQQHIGGKWYYLNDTTGAVTTGFKYIQSQRKTVYYAANGQLQYGQQHINGSWYYFDDITGGVVTGWKYIAAQKKTVYYAADGKMLYGQQHIGGKWYYLNDTTGAVTTGFKYIQSQRKTVYYATNGQLQYGQQHINGKWYYFDSVTGAMKTGFQLIKNQNKIVYYNAAGQMLYGRQKINGITYSLNTVSGALSISNISLQLAETNFAQKTNQTIVTVANYKKTANVYLYQKDTNGIWSQVIATSAGHVGYNGLGKTYEGAGKTPQGAYTLGTAFGSHASVSTGLSYRQADSRSYWIEDVNDSAYNTWQERSYAKAPSEHLLSYPTQYEYGIVINYNTNPVVKGAGSGFFVHVSTGGSTAGCVSVPRSVLIAMLAKLNKGAYIVNVNTESQISSY